MKSPLAMILVTLALTGATGCNKKAQAPATVWYELSGTDGNLTGLTVIIGSERKTFAKDAYGATTIKASATLPATGPSVLPTLAVELPTPCGTKTIALSTKETAAEEESQRKSEGHSVYLKVTPSSPIPRAVDIWIDSTGDVALGSLTLKQGQNRVYELECQPSLELRSGGNVLGPLPKVDGSATKAVFVTTKDQCYVYRGVSYSKDPSAASSAGTILKGKHVYELDENVDHFLTPAPSATRGESYRMELVPVACP
ncbi:hypothetical protein [Polyangium sp. y55x31]|uniref:hypothetical protein n=1 Tax=Polyangium sp. y55x31 TaxID=3042688 RepID=UPI0024830712|nr:hypothetical protein [Polyangium sp. y55x31]MDI1484177.1 hypothetical protein [Polyangium sp. y55x31]